MCAASASVHSVIGLRHTDTTSRTFDKMQERGFVSYVADTQEFGGRVDCFARSLHELFIAINILVRGFKYSTDDWESIPSFYIFMSEGGFSRAFHGDCFYSECQYFIIDH